MPQCADAFLYDNVVESAAKSTVCSLFRKHTRAELIKAVKHGYG
jgi:hypothetical protein